MPPVGVEVTDNWMTPSQAFEPLNLSVLADEASTAHPLPKAETHEPRTVAKTITMAKAKSMAFCQSKQRVWWNAAVMVGCALLLFAQ